MYACIFVTVIQQLYEVPLQVKSVVSNSNQQNQSLRPLAKLQRGQADNACTCASGEWANSNMFLSKVADTNMFQIPQTKLVQYECRPTFCKVLHLSQPTYFVPSAKVILKQVM